jgi:2,3,4,5-tetrahydropyridine-2-carboxylate N-succinyltransferase
MSNLYSFAIGAGTKNSRGEWLEVFYPKPVINPESALEKLLTGIFRDNTDIEPTSDQLTTLQTALEENGYSDLAASVNILKGGNRSLVVAILKHDSPPTSVPESYLKLHLLSHRLVKQNGQE